MGYLWMEAGVCVTFVFSLVLLGIDNVSGTIVTTESGTVEGVSVPLQNATIYQFRRIPYAKPPLGLLRFSKPVKIPPWNNTLDATTFGPVCIQSTDAGSNFSLTMSEDCLFLNIYVPNEISTTANKSVMVWIHGGGYTTGSGIFYDGTSLAIHGDVIVVTLNYRLGVFGFLSTGDSSARGNYGLWDQIEALKWIKSNIKYFGGNPDSITIFGESAGAFSVSQLALIPQNKGLFNRVIMQSGSVGSYGSIMKDPLANARALGGVLACSDIQNTESLVSCLRGVEASDLNSAADIAYTYAIFLKSFGLALPIGPVIDGELIMDNPISLLQNQSSEQFKFFQSLDVISGCNSAEGSLAILVIPFAFPSVNLSEGIPSWVVMLFTEALTELFYNNDTRVLQLINYKYISADFEEQGRHLVNLLGDSHYIKPMMESLLFHDSGMDSNASTFQYFFSKTSPVDPLLGVPPRWFDGAGHGAELRYIFDSVYGSVDSQGVLASQMMSYWTNFAKHGNPNIGLPVPNWPEFDENTRTYINLDTEVTTGSDLLGSRIRFWTDEIPRLMSETELEIDTAMGPIKGFVQKIKGKTITQFRKVPFAKPPIGPLRFAKPVPFSSWTGTLDATRFGPSCIQTVDPSTQAYLPNPNISEDCLFLNIYVPNEVLMTANKTVMVWIHGGSYTSGSGMLYDGTSLAIHGDVIVVTVNYRLGVFGYLSTEDSSARGNYGLWDQIEALKWIKSNIKYFGGNPDSITLFGESAGAFSVSHLALIPQNKGLFHRVIMQSGSVGSAGSITKDPLKYSRALGNYLTCTDTHNTVSLISCLRGIDASDLQKGGEIIYMSIPSLNVFELKLAPVIDGDLIPNHPILSLQNQSSEQFLFYQSLDVISGCNSAEGSEFLSLFQFFPYLSLPAVDISDGIPSWAVKLFVQTLTEVNYDNDTRILQPIYNQYISTNEGEQGRQLVNLLGDIVFCIPVFESLMIHDMENSNSKTFQYFFSYHQEIEIELGFLPKWFQGAGHGAELASLFGDSSYLLGDKKYISTEMMSYWTNFAHYGNPNIGLPVSEWPEFDENTRRFINLDRDITSGSDLLGDRIRFWTDKVPRIMSETELVIDTAMGPIKGVVQNIKGATMNEFRKIPFAKPPIGPLRFAKPVPFSGWTGTLDATRFGPSCIQTMYPGSESSLPNPSISEDCLFLNIYVPNEVLMTANKSVMVWIHGGGYTSGAGMMYDGTSLAIHGDVIVVTLNYRLGVFGFLSTGDSSARGNYGLWDQIEALKWIKSNIKYFGGNPDSITLFGESAGALSISHLVLIPQNKGLFHRAIMQSGTLGSFGAITKDPLAKTRSLGSYLSCRNIDNTTLLVSCLRGIDTPFLQSGSDIIYSAFTSLSDLFQSTLSPVFDGELIPSHPFLLLQNQSSEQFAFYQSIDVISGCNSAEASAFLAFLQLIPPLSLPAVDISNGIPSWVVKLFAQSVTEVFYNNDTKILQPIYDKYIFENDEEQGRQLMNLLGDIIFYVPMFESLLIHDKGGNSKSKTFQYFFSNQPEVDPLIGVPPKWFQGAGHFAEVKFLFDNWGYVLGEDKKLSTEMMSYWSNFARYGNPNMGITVPNWPEFDENTRPFINLDTDITTGSDLFGDRMRLWTDKIPRLISETELEIDTAMGPIKGYVEKVRGKMITQFRKIPFAKPPIGPLRFGKPVPVSSWTGTLDATRFGPSCIQTVDPSIQAYLPNPNISEDCLFLNIYVPNEVRMTSNKSVMVWIHGGGYRSGAGMLYDGTSLAIHGDVIVVTLNYRLGVFGFLSTGDSSAKGNYGLWDQIEALKWIKSNIKYFGGNPDSITLFGGSAGAFSISHLALVPQNKGLFHRVIMQSGSVGSGGSIAKDPLKYSRALGNHLTCTDTHNTVSLISCLREIDASDLQRGGDIIYLSRTSLNIGESSLAPVIDGELIPRHPMLSLQNQSSEQFLFYQSLDVISGCNSAEGSLFLIFFRIFPYLSLPAVDISDGIPSWAVKLFVQALTEVYYDNDTRILQPIYNQYISGDEGEQGRHFVNLMGDIVFYMPMLESIMIHDRGNSNSKTFQYFFSFHQEIDPLLGVPPKWFQGAGHGAEVFSLFDDSAYLLGDKKYISTEIMSYWTNFAHYGNPNIGLPVSEWPEFDANTRRYINFDTDITTGSDLLGDRIRFWTDKVPRIMSETELVIDTAMGPIKGVAQNIKGETINEFRKIPFAKPPIGPLRFAKPVPISGWTGTLDATRFGPSCIQTIYPPSESTLPNPNISEDCLFLNIYVPNEVLTTANKSVMVWIHGGGYTTGSGIFYDGTSLAIHGDVIVVTLNYRLGVFGFLSTGDSSARGNYGLWDQIEALKWIKSNIKYFGGNPDSITLFGESAGAFSISHLVLIPQNKGLFHRAIMQSGSLDSFGSIKKDPLAKTRSLGNYLSCNNTDNTALLVSCLRGIDASALQSGSNFIYSRITSLAGLFEFNLSPVIDGELIPSHPLSLLRNQSSEQFTFYQSIDVISGCNSAEASVFLMFFGIFPMLSLPPVNISNGVPSWAVKLIAQSVTELNYNNDTRILQPIYDKYISENDEEQGRRLVDLLGDITFYVPMSESLLIHDKGLNSKSKTFQYFFSNQPEVDPMIGIPPKWFQGAGHFAEVKFLFDNWGYVLGEDKELSMEMMSYWTNFARYGNPNIGLPVSEWPEFNENTRRYINLDTDITTGSDLLGDRIRFWTDKVPRIMSETELVIDTAVGPIKGVVQNIKGETINEFRKIPFAKPPIGPLRFAKPVPISRWTGTLDATRFGPSCIQTIFPGTESSLPNKNMSEDCLFLNIYVPNQVLMTANKSVMVWIHGGGYTSGAGMMYDVTSLAIHGDVIVVTVNYRLGAFGFLSTGDSSARGNYGLWDQIEALKWIKSNIRYFGGNPDSITLFGESAGAFSISHLSIIPQNKGLFHRIIMQSGSLGSGGSITEGPLKYSRSLGSYFSCSNTDNTTLLVSCLRGIDASVLQSGSDIIYSRITSLAGSFELTLSPVIDGELIPSHPLSLLLDHTSEQFTFYQSIDVISGCNSAEASIFLGLLGIFPLLSLPPVDISNGVPSWAVKLFAQSVTELNYNNDTRILQPIYDKYISENDEEQGRRLVNLVGDITFYVPMFESLLIHDKGNSKSKTFQYLFSNQPEVDPLIGVPPKWFQGAGHFAEVKFLFDNWGYVLGEDKELSMEMMSYWTNFARYGDPNIGLPVQPWPEYDASNRRFVNLDTNITEGSDLFGDRMRLWTEEIPQIMSVTTPSLSTTSVTTPSRTTTSVITPSRTTPFPGNELSGASRGFASYFMLCLSVIISVLYIS